MKRKFRNFKRRVELWWLYLPIGNRTTIEFFGGLLIWAIIMVAAGYACYVIGQGIVNPV